MAGLRPSNSAISRVRFSLLHNHSSKDKIILESCRLPTYNADPRGGCAQIRGQACRSLSPPVALLMGFG